MIPRSDSALMSQGDELVMNEDDLIVSKTDLSSHITYANPEFCYYSGYTVEELIGRPQNIVRHPDMPKAIFELMWSHLKEENEFFGYVKNRRKNGGFYWTFASVAPVYENGQAVGYLSARRKPKPEVLPRVANLYQQMCEVERAAPDGQKIPRSSAMLWQIISKDFDSYAEFILSL